MRALLKGYKGSEKTKQMLGFAGRKDRRESSTLPCPWTRLFNEAMQG